MKELHIALAGNPNCGKTTLFNALTGARHRVGNWPGVTVERVDGEYRHGETLVHVTDLPGIYSFSAYSIDESIARQHILLGHPDLVVNIVDATNLERNLYLTTQLLEMRAPVVVALNMMDVAHRRRIKVEVGHLERHLGCPVVPVVASRGIGIPELRRAIDAAARSGAVSATHVEYDSELEKAIACIRAAVHANAREKGVDDRWLALKLLEQDELAAELTGDANPSALVAGESRRVEAHTGEDIDIVIADGRYGFIHGLARDVVHRDLQVRQTVSDAIDRVLLNRAMGIPLFLVIMYVVFMITIHVGAPFLAFFDRLCGTVFVEGFGRLLAGLHAPEWLILFLADGIGGGIQTVSTFIPPIFFIFLCLSFLEDSGYMARAAFVMDRLLRSIGLPGKAFIPMLVGFGCNVPAILATRTLENNRDRILTILMNPFMSCGARLPVYTLFVAAFFPRQGGPVLFGLYATGIVLAILTGLLFKRTILSGETSTFVMELPPYHLPTARGVLYHTWNRLQSFIVRAGRVILVVVVVMSVLGSIGTGGDGEAPGNGADSLLGAMSRRVTPVFRPMGVTAENWPAAVGLFTGLFAKEAVVGTLDTLYAQAEHRAGPDAGDAGGGAFRFWEGVADAFAAIPAGFRDLAGVARDPLGLGEGARTADRAAAAGRLGVRRTTLSAMVRYFDGKAGALAYLLFILIYAPCMATIAAIYRETNAGWAAFAVFYLTFLAWCISTLFYQAATFQQHPASSAMWLTGVLVALAGLVGGLKTWSLAHRSEP